MKRRVSARKKMSDGVDRKAVRWFGIVERLSRERFTDKVDESELKGRRDTAVLEHSGWTESKRTFNARSMERSDAKVMCIDRKHWKNFVIMCMSNV